MSKSIAADPNKARTAGSTRPCYSPRRVRSEHEGRRALILGVVVAVLAGILLLPGLGDMGLWSEGEMAVFDRVAAAMGEPRAELTRSAWLPDALRTWSYTHLGSNDFSLRLPSALAGITLVLLTFVCARRLGWSLRWVGTACGFALALPLLLVSARTMLGQASGELWMTGAVLALVAALDVSPTNPGARFGARSLAVRLGLGLTGATCLAASVASTGLLMGGCLPLAVIALAELAPVRGRGRSSEVDTPTAPSKPENSEPGTPNPKTPNPENSNPENSSPGWVLTLPKLGRVLLWTAAAGCGFWGLWLVVGQGEGFIPLLAASRDLGLVETPTGRVFSASLEEYGYLVFPFTGLIAAGLLTPGRARWPALWLGIALIFASLNSLVYGPTPAPVLLPSALLATAALERILDPREPIAARRLLVTIAVLGALVLAKDAGRVPGSVASPLLHVPKLLFPGPFPGAEHLDFGARLSSLAKHFAAALLVAHTLAPASDDQRRAWDRLDAPPWWLRRWRAVEARIPWIESLRALAPVGLIVVVLAIQSVGFGRLMLGDLGEQMSIAQPLRSWRAGVAAGEFPDSPLGLHRIRDPGLARYGPDPGDAVFLPNRSDLDRWLADPEPRTALIRRRDLPPAFAHARTHDQPLYVLDQRHHTYLLVANVLPEGMDDQNPLLPVLLAERPQLANETLVSWDPYISLVGWELDGPLHRGSSVTLRLVFEVRRPLPAGSKLYARLQKGKSSRVAAAPRPLTNGILPPNFWRAGDIILHEETLEVPWLEVLPGEHELIVGLRRSEKSNLKISEPAEGEGAFGATIKGKSHEFAVIGTAELAW